jgi:DNA-binding CsgD family transcriptional regulator
MDLLEREPHLAQLRLALADSRAGAGRLCLVSGEAGIGKTALLEEFASGLARQGDGFRVFWGSCDALFTPRPMGPIFDIAHQFDALHGAVESHASDRESFFRTFLNALGRSSDARVVVFEDVHWADEATLDLLKFVGRRIRQVHALVIVTYRDDELRRESPLWQLLGELPRSSLRRIPLPCLTESAVAALAERAGRDATGLFRRTRGNPFFVSEVLANDGVGVPTSVREAVFARASRLCASGRMLLDIVSLVPARIERWLLAELGGEAVSSLEECLGSGVLETRQDRVWFRHDLARQAWEEGLEETRRRELHRRLLHALLERGDAAPARLIHHAAGSGNARQVLQLAPIAADEAAGLGAHREAAAILSAAVPHAALLPPAEHAALLDRFAFECNLTARVEDAVVAQERALALWRELGDRRKEGNALRFLSRLYWYRGDGERVRRYAAAATDVLEPLGPSLELATAYGSRAQLHMLRNETADALAWGDRAIAMARALDEPNPLMYALNTVGTARLGAGDIGGRALIEESLRLALERNRHADVTRAYCNLASTAADWYQWDQAREHLEAGLAYCDRWGIDTQLLCMISDRALVWLYTGEWEAAASAATALLRRRGAQSVQRVSALAALARVRARRGDPGARQPLDEARSLAVESGEMQRIQPVAAATAEAAWLDERPVPEEVLEWYALALERATPWGLGEIAYWLWRCGAIGEPPPRCAEPYRLQIQGDWRAAAAAWERTGCPFHRALALAESGDEQAGRDGFALLAKLGADAVVERLKRELRARGVGRIPRGPRPATRGNPAQLTRRQLDVLRLLGGGLTNEQIARRLFLSPRTVAHHVSAILAKLHAGTRTEAAATAHALGIPAQFGPPGGPS